MFGGSRMHGPAWLTGGAHFAIIVIAAQFETAAVWPWALMLMCGVSFLAWLGNYRRYRQISDLPTSKAASAAQGYVELVGRGELLDGEPVLSRLSHRPCCWYRYEIEEQNSDNKWSTIDEGSSVAHFLLIDDTGQCVISPEGAEVVTSEHRTWEESPYRYNEWLLPPKTILYAVGEFTTVSGNTDADLEERKDIAVLIDVWKRDQKTLQERFDLNKDGTIDMKEWELARMQATREVRKARAAMVKPLVEGVHLLRKPKDGRLFLLANEMPDALGKRFMWWSALHFALMIGTGTVSLILF